MRLLRQRPSRRIQTEMLLRLIKRGLDAAADSKRAVDVHDSALDPVELPCEDLVERSHFVDQTQLFEVFQLVARLEQFVTDMVYIESPLLEGPQPQVEDLLS